MQRNVDAKASGTMVIIGVSVFLLFNVMRRRKRECRREHHANSYAV